MNLDVPIIGGFVGVLVVGSGLALSLANDVPPQLAAAMSVGGTVVNAPFDYQGVAILLGAITVFLTGLVTSILTILTFNRQGEIAKLSRQTHDLVNGLSARSDAAIGRASFAEGKEAGVATERAAPQVAADGSPPPSAPPPSQKTA